MKIILMFKSETHGPFLSFVVYIPSKRLYRANTSMRYKDRQCPSKKYIINKLIKGKIKGNQLKKKNPNR